MECFINSVFFCIAVYFFFTRFFQFGPRKSFVYFYGITAYASLCAIGFSLLFDGLGSFNVVNWSLVIRLSISLILFNVLAMALCLIDLGGHVKQKRISTRLPIIGMLLTPLIEEQYFRFFGLTVLVVVFFIFYTKRTSDQMLFRSFKYPFVLSIIVAIVSLVQLNYFFINNIIAILILVTIGKMINDLMVKDIFLEKVKLAK
jgi:hypothetical protein